MRSIVRHVAFVSRVTYNGMTPPHVLPRYFPMASLPEPNSLFRGRASTAVLRALCRVALCVATTLMPGSVVVADAEYTFERDVRPIFRAHCFDCHGATEELKGELDLRLVKFLRRGGASGPAIDVGAPATSLLIERIRDGEMPPGNGHVTPDELAVLEAWIADGAPTARPEPDSIGTGLGITPEERSYWAFQPIRRPHVANSEHAGQHLSPIDRLLQQRMPDGMTFAPEADRATLVKRAYLLLLGMPPTMSDIEHWRQASDDAWFSRLVDHLLSSPQYGERWGRHWLDVAGYADSEGVTEQDAARNWAWHYRDWVIQAWNDNLSFDQFITSQIAGDEVAGPLSGAPTEWQQRHLAATGFLRMAADGTGSGRDSPGSRNQVIADTLKIVATSLLGLSLQCAQCHDHRYDPIPQEDYFALRAIFEPALDWNDWQTPQQRLVSLASAQDRARSAEIESDAQRVAEQRSTEQAEFIREELEKQLERVDDETLRAPLREAYDTVSDQRTEEQNRLLATYPFVRQLSPGSLYLYNKEAADRLKSLDKEIAAIRARKPTEQFLRVLRERPGHVPVTHLHFRGDFEQPRQVVAPHALTVACPEDQLATFPLDDPAFESTGRRTAFAAWLVDRNNPLVARVFVNRIWMHHFGQGIVVTPSDFGQLGLRPTHPELLDWLADEFLRDGDIKRLQRAIVLSRAWRQESRTSSASNVDAVRYYARRRLIRMEAEAIRDRVLSVAQSIDYRMFGEPVPVERDATGQVFADAKQPRRSLYIDVRRSQPVGLLQTFDAPVMQTNCELRARTTAATQSLMLINGQFILDQAARIANQIVSMVERSNAGIAGSETDRDMESIRGAWQIVLARNPEVDENELARTFLARQRRLLQGTDRLPEGRTVEVQALVNLSQMLLASNEFLYIE